MAPYMLAYMKNNTAPINEITVGNMVWILGLAVFGLGASMSFGGFIEPKLGTFFTILLGSWTMSFGVIVTYWTIKVHLALVAISYGLIMGLGVGVAYGVILSVPSEWFPNSSGLVTGIVVAGFGFGPITFDFLQLYYINRDITGVNLIDASRVPSSFLLMGCIYAVLQLVGTMMIRRPYSQKSESQRGEPNNILFDTIINEQGSTNNINLRPHQLLLERDFWILWITYALNSVVAVLILSLHKVYGKALSINDSYLTIISAAGAFCNGFGRIVWGYFNDKIAYKVLMSILSICMALMVGTFYMCTLIGDIKTHDYVNRIVMYFVWVVILHFLLSGNFSLFPNICCKTFGNEHFTGNYGILFTGYSFAGIITSVMTTRLFDVEDKFDSYLTPFVVASGLSLLSTGITLFYRGKSLIYHNENL